MGFAASLAAEALRRKQGNVQDAVQLSERMQARQAQLGMPAHRRYRSSLVRNVSRRVVTAVRHPVVNVLWKAVLGISTVLGSVLAVYAVVS